MAEESHYSSSDNKRKYDDSPAAPSSRRATGFSAPLSSLSPTDGSQNTASYNSVPPPMDEIQLAKQKAQEIAARLYNSASNAEAKKPRVESDNGGGYDSNEGMYQKPYSSMAPPQGGSTGYSSGGYSSGGYSSTSKKIDVPNGRVGVIIGKGGETIKYLQSQSGAKIQVTRDMDADPNSPTRAVELMGTPDQISRAEDLIQEVLAEAAAGGSAGAPRRGEQGGSDRFTMIVPNNKVGLVIGKGGETIKSMQSSTGARIQVIPLHLPPGDTSGERTVQIDGTSEQIEAAKQLVNEVISENRMRNQGGMSGYSQQGYQARPQTNWAPPAPPMQQPGYGYVQPGTYQGSAPQYPNQPAYPGYPPQPAHNGYATGWDQTGAPPNQQPGGYDYYGQQTAAPQPPTGAPGAPADNSGYGYNQQPASGYNQNQSYSQDPYGAYAQSGYGQPQTNPTTGYDQQQGYNSAAGYASATNPTPDGHSPYGTTQGNGDGTQVPPAQSSATGQQSYPTGQQPSPKPGYPPQPQPGYGVPPTSQAGYATQPPGAYYAPPQQVQKPPPSGPPSYGQPQQSPTAQSGGYDQSYPPVQPTYAQPETTGQQPPTGYGPPPSAYGGAPPPSYGAPPPNYGQPQGPMYGAGYGSGGGYTQPQAYSGDGSARATSESTPPSQAAVQPSGPAKASPPS